MGKHNKNRGVGQFIYDKSVVKLSIIAIFFFCNGGRWGLEQGTIIGTFPRANHVQFLNAVFNQSEISTMTFKLVHNLELHVEKKCLSCVTLTQVMLKQTMLIPLSI